MNWTKKFKKWACVLSLLFFIPPIQAADSFDSYAIKEVIESLLEQGQFGAIGEIYVGVNEEKPNANSSAPSSNSTPSNTNNTNSLNSGSNTKSTNPISLLDLHNMALSMYLQFQTASRDNHDSRVRESDRMRIQALHNYSLRLLNEWYMAPSWDPKGDPADIQFPKSFVRPGNIQDIQFPDKVLRAIQSGEIQIDLLIQYLNYTFDVNSFVFKAPKNTQKSRSTAFQLDGELSIILVYRLLALDVALRLIDTFKPSLQDQLKNGIRNINKMKRYFEDQTRLLTKIYHWALRPEARMYKDPTKTYDSMERFLTKDPKTGETVVSELGIIYALKLGTQALNTSRKAPRDGIPISQIDLKVQLKRGENGLLQKTDSALSCKNIF